jgi:hypothetical protein
MLLMRVNPYEGKWEGVGPWKSRHFWALWIGIEPSGEFHLGPKNIILFQTLHMSIREWSEWNEGNFSSKVSYV